MPHSDHYRTMTDAQLAEWDQLHRRAERLAVELAEEKRIHGDAQAVVSILRCELALVMQSVRAFTNALCAGVPVLAQASWPGDVYRAWEELDETVRSAAKCLQ